MGRTPDHGPPEPGVAAGRDHQRTINDRNSIGSWFREVAEGGGGHFIKAVEADSSLLYAVPESVTAWLTELDEKHGTESYGALNNPPHAQAGSADLLTTVNIVIKHQPVLRRAFMDTLLAAGATAAFVVMVGSVAMALSPGLLN